MKNQLMTFEYETNNVQFYNEDNGVVMVNATQMAKIYDKRIDFFLKSENTKSFINVLEFTPFGGNSTPLKPENIIKTRGQSGTWMHRILALKFAAWLDPRFELWVFTTIDRILIGDLTEMKEYKEEVIDLERQRKEIIEVLNHSYNKIANNIHFMKYLEAEKQLKSITRKISAIGNKATRSFLGADLFSQIKN